MDKVSFLLRKKLGKRFDEIMKWDWDRITNFTVERDDNGFAISAIIQGKEGIYSTFISSTEGYSCSCIGQTAHKTLCKHVGFLLMYAYINGYLSYEEVIRVVG